MKGSNMKATITAAAACLALLAGCGTSTHQGNGPSTPAQAAAPSSTAAPASSASAQPTEPVTKAGVKAAASKFYDLYSAAQYGAAFQFVDPAQQQTIGKATYLAVFKGCPSQSEGLARVIKKVTLAGHTAVVTETIAGIASKLGSVTDSFVYKGGKWYYHYPTQVMDLYAHGSVAADVAAANKAGYCASS